MGLFGRGKKGNRDEPPRTGGDVRARPGGDFLSPLWSEWPPEAEAEPKPVVTPPPPPVVVTPPPPPVVVTPAPPPARPALAPKSTNPPPVPGPAVVVHAIRAISEPPVPARSGRTRSQEMRAAVERLDWNGARKIAEEILARDPTDLDAYVCIENCNHQLRVRAEIRLGERTRLLRQAVPDEWLADMDLDPRVAYMLSRIDGSSTIDEVIDLSGMAPSEAILALADLLEEGVLEAVTPSRRPSSQPPR
jgi:hypothetical protein